MTSRSDRLAALYATPCTYRAALIRVYKARGPARDWHCLRCGLRAQKWAHQAGSAREQSGDVTTYKRGRAVTVRMTWSPDPADYVPLCDDCHGRATRNDYKRGYRHLPADEKAAKQREWRRAAYQRQVSTPEGREAYRESKRRQAAIRAANTQETHRNTTTHETEKH